MMQAHLASLPTCLRGLQMALIGQRPDRSACDARFG
jgi:hypothetical protein